MSRLYTEDVTVIKQDAWGNVEEVITFSQLYDRRVEEERLHNKMVRIITLAIITIVAIAALIAGNVGLVGFMGFVPLKPMATPRYKKKYLKRGPVHPPGFWLTVAIALLGTIIIVVCLWAFFNAAPLRMY